MKNQEKLNAALRSVVIFNKDLKMKEGISRVTPILTSGHDRVRVFIEEDQMYVLFPDDSVFGDRYFDFNDTDLIKEVYEKVMLHGNDADISEEIFDKDFKPMTASEEELEEIEVSIKDIGKKFSATVGSDSGNFMIDAEEKYEYEDDDTAKSFDTAIKKQEENKDAFNGRPIELSDEELEDIEILMQRLYSNLKGIYGKKPSFRPTKKLFKKAVGLDSDKAYLTKDKGKDKVIKLNLLIDRSGSMSGEPTRYSLKMIYIFNKLAKEGLAEVKVFNSASSVRNLVTLPINNDELLSMTKLLGDEGLYKTSKHYEQHIKNIPLICISDFDIVDQPIIKSDWEAIGTSTLGLYINSSSKTVPSDKGKKWFDHAFVCGSLEDAVEKILFMRW